MKEKVDFTEIKEMCDRLGVDCQIIENGVLITQKKDPWDGVEFFFSSWSGRIFRRDHIDTIDIENHNEHLSPSTEEAYKEQKINEAFERFGEIMFGDKFNFNGIEYEARGSGDYTDYFKVDDSFFYLGAKIYQSGKWATRVKERVEVKPIGLNQERCGIGVLVNFAFEVNSLDFTLNGASTFLSSQLEKYLNREV